MSLVLFGCFVVPPVKDNEPPAGERWLSVDLTEGVVSNWKLVTFDGKEAFTDAGDNESCNTVLYLDDKLPSEFELSAKIYQTKDNQWSGVVFNFSDAGEFYVLRMRSGRNRIQLLARNGSKWQTLADQDGVTSATLNSWVEFNVVRTSDKIAFSVGEFSVEVVLSQVDPPSDYDGAYAGYFSAASTSDSPVYFADFNVQELDK